MAMYHRFEEEGLIDDQNETPKHDQLVESTSKLFHNQISDDLVVPYDVTFLVNNQKFFKAHKFLLGLRSPVFNRMFWPSANLTIEPTDYINIPDLEPDAFENLLKYIYTDEVVKNFEDFSSTFKAADKYLISGLCKKLLEYIDKVLTVDNAVIIYDQYLKLGQLQYDERLDLNNLFDTINLHSYLVLNSANFLKISKDTLIELLENESLLIDEIDLFSCCLRWIKHNLNEQNKEPNQINQRELFNLFKHLIRFPLMSKDEFFGTQKQQKKEDFIPSEIPIEIPAKSGLFTDEELNEFERYFSTKDLKLFSMNYKSKKRDELRVARLDYDWKNHCYKMMKIDDDKLINYDGNLVYRDTDGLYTDEKLQELKSRCSINLNTQNADRQAHSNDHEFDNESEYESDIEHTLDYGFAHDYDYANNGQIKILKQAKSAKRRLVKENDEEAIYVFKIRQIAGNNEFNNNLEFDIFANSYHSSQSNRPRYYRNYFKNNASFNCIFPMIELKKDQSYQIQSYHKNYNRFGFTRFGSISFKIEKIFNQTGDIDVQTRILSGKNPCALSIYFLYKKP